MINLFQIQMMCQYKNTPLLEKYIKKEDFLYILLNHLKEYFFLLGKETEILEPLLQSDIEYSQKTTFSIDKEEIGEIYFLNTSSNSVFTFFIYHNQGKDKFNFFQKKDYQELTVRDYFRCLHLLIHISQFYLNEKEG